MKLPRLQGAPGRTQQPNLGQFRLLYIAKPPETMAVKTSPGTYQVSTAALSSKTGEILTLACQPCPNEEDGPEAISWVQQRQIRSHNAFSLPIFSITR